MIHRTIHDTINDQIELTFREGFAARQTGEAYNPNGETSWRHGWKSADGMITGCPLPEKDQAMVDSLGLTIDEGSR